MTSLVMNVAGKTATGDLATPIDFAGGRSPTRLRSLEVPDSLRRFGHRESDRRRGGLGDRLRAERGYREARQQRVLRFAPREDLHRRGGPDASVHYDRSLAAKFFTLGNYVMTSFSWKKY